MLKKLLPIFVATVVSATTLYAATVCTSTDEIINFQQQLTQLKQKTTLPVVAPSVFPLQAHKKYYLSTDVMPNQKGYSMSVDYTAKCHGAQYCSAGSMLVQQNGQLQTDVKDQHGKVLTQKVKLANNIQGYYTPGFSAGTFVPPSISWQIDKMIYTISWQHVDDKKTAQADLVAMANSVIKH